MAHRVSKVEGLEAGNPKPVSTRTEQSKDIASWQIVPFLSIVFGLAWSLFALFVLRAEWVEATFGELSGSHPLFILAVYAPAMAALLIVSLNAGVAGIARFLSRLSLWRVSWQWYAFLIVGFPIIFFLGSIVKGNAMTAPLFTENIIHMLPLIGFMMVLGPIEEIGWRGSAQQ